MNKNTISWIHYMYVTVTASVLAYVTSMDMGDKNENEPSAIDMLPNIMSTEETQEEVYEEPQEEEVFEEPQEEEVYEEPQEEEVFEEPQEEVYQESSRISELPVAEPVNTVTSSNGGKLKKNKTKNKKSKNNKTHNRK